jgi:uncharacterized membrane protein
MPLKSFLDSDLVQVFLVYLTSLIITLVNFKDVLSIIALSISILFTLYKWRKEYKKKK